MITFTKDVTMRTTPEAVDDPKAVVVFLIHEDKVVRVSRLQAEEGLIESGMRHLIPKLDEFENPCIAVRGDGATAIGSAIPIGVSPATHMSPGGVC